MSWLYTFAIIKLALSADLTNDIILGGLCCDGHVDLHVTRSMAVLEHYLAHSRLT